MQNRKGIAVKEVVDAVNHRIKSPYFGYSVLAFLALNWRALFLLFVTEGNPQERLAAFDSATSGFTLIALPLLVGAIVAASTPWVRYLFDLIARRPTGLIDNLHLEAEHRRTIRHTELERSRSNLFATREEELIERAKRDEKVLEIEDQNVKEKLESQIEQLRQERDRLSEQSRNEFSPSQLSSAESEILKAAAKAGDGSILRNIHLGGREIQIGLSHFGKNSQREFSKYDSALMSLLSKGLLKKVGVNDSSFELTHEGWQVADGL